MRQCLVESMTGACTSYIFGRSQTPSELVLQVLCAVREVYTLLNLTRNYALRGSLCFVLIRLSTML